MSNKPISLKQALYRSGLGTSLFTFITLKAKNECEINLNNMIALAGDIHQEVHRALLKHAPQPIVNKLLNCVVYRKSDPLGQASFRAGLCTSLYEVILEQASQYCSEELHDLLSLACDINQEVYYSLYAAVNGEDE
ncbi:hypothetical protein KKJ06_18810 [Xenorhabdus bovienii]|uniref:hypothetical protein n=1 Tax=Xenorhabdus bovienii TaxID=40576 RepID=UPI00237D045D|nr:hypothetical protein [Xenorhabdus bovienii]MDE1482172.1 hypothetical protein [Xenorhabdus bovienii]MDE9465608.1 hypothetical protein [Xenorhabdus bovienii]MDE9468821.1 hypothetical protein [Xenorhabdus bovienii]MDE9547584.1 hypothetical protein [Xenorhabdus bovienii]MDE9557415.1 hypothetical protein [Xenorhabdus bovienii]